jgi:hypothetical protein
MNPTQMSDDLLFNTTVDAITRAAYDENSGNDSGAYEQAMDLMRESRRRLTEAGHDQWCQDDIYTRAHREAMARQLGHAAEPTECTCERGNS